jgi:hypothetical protein
LLIAHHLSLGGDTMEMMRAVLDSNFWLATHVVTVTAGYSATFLAGLPRHHLHRARPLHPSLDAATADALTRMVYGIVCFATLFSFVGTDPRRHLGRPIVGPLLGLGPEGKRRPHHRDLERPAPARALGRLPVNAASWPSPSAATSSPPGAGSA